MGVRETTKCLIDKKRNILMSCHIHRLMDESESFFNVSGAKNWS